jgi:hypothetical protein
VCSFRHAAFERVSTYLSALSFEPNLEKKIKSKRQNMEIEPDEYLSLSAYLVQSSLAMNDALVFLASHPANADISSALSFCLDSAKLLLTMVVYCLINP